MKTRRYEMRPKYVNVSFTPWNPFLTDYQFHDTMNELHLLLYGPGLGPIDASFEEAEARLKQLPRLHFEPDGSFVWVDSGQRIAGNLYDAAGKIQYCELHGECSLRMWKDFFQSLTGSPQPQIELMRLPSRVLQTLQSFESEWSRN